MILAQPLRCNGESVCVARVKQPLTTFPLLLELGSEGLDLTGYFVLNIKIGRSSQNLHVWEYGYSLKKMRWDPRFLVLNRLQGRLPM